MASRDVPALLATVRRRLWGDELIAAARGAAWASAALALLATAVHLGAHGLPLAGVALASALPWGVLLARAGWRRPMPATCALWADRHLGGRSAFSTWLEFVPGPADATPLPAAAFLAQWTSAQVPQALRQLAETPRSPRLLRPLLAMAMCMALAALVLALPGQSPAAAPAAATASAAPGPVADRPLALAADAATAPDLAADLAKALRSAPTPEAAARQPGGGQPQAAAPGQTDDAASALPAPPGAAAPRAQPGQPATAAAPASDQAPPPGAAQAAGAGAGRQAGDSRDERADVGVSRGPRQPLAVQRSAAGMPRPLTGRHADARQSARYDDAHGLPGAAAARADLAAAAATPPPATDPARLGPTETSYVQAWMKASAARR
jgi:hypothetical protein